MSDCIRIYETQSHVRSFEARVLRCLPVEELQPGKWKDCWASELDQTAFFPGGGGQECDKGTLDGQEVLHVQELDHVIWHITAQPLQTGSNVHGELDWDLRFSCMQNHSGEHIFSGLVHSRFGYDNVGFHMGHAAITMDFNGEITPEQLRELEYEANRVITNNLYIKILFPSDADLSDMDYRSKIELSGRRVRIVEIPGVDLCACCAPHVEQTGEIGMLKVLSGQRYKQGTRVSILCGFRWLHEANEGYGILHELGVRMSASQEKLLDYYEGFVRDQKQLQGQLESVSAALIQRIVREYTQNAQKYDAEPIVLEIVLADSIAMRKLCNELVPCTKRFVFVYHMKNDTDANFLLASASENCREIFAEFQKAFEGKVRGGGSPAMVQGSCQVAPEALKGHFLGTFLR